MRTRRYMHMHGYVCMRDTHTQTHKHTHTHTHTHRCSSGAWLKSPERAKFASTFPNLGQWYKSSKKSVDIDIDIYGIFQGTDF
jgi:hypothetical protein